MTADVRPPSPIKRVRLVLVLACVAATPCLAASERKDPRPLASPAERAAHLAALRVSYAPAPATWPAPHLDPGVEHRELAPLPAAPHPADNPPAPAMVALGRRLFFDPRLSGSGQIACASCHDPDLGWADGRTVPFGHNRRRLRRNAPSILNAAHRASLFWDGRAGSLEDQARAVLENADEMHSGDEVVMGNLTAIPEYVAAFREAMGVESPTVSDVSKAIAAFERTVVSDHTRLDRFLEGRRDLLTDAELAGLHLFRTEGRCLNCHSGPIMTDDRFHNVGLSLYGRRFEDNGRYEVTGDPADVGAFRTPSLRDVTHTAPHMHSGLFSLREVLRLYNAGMPSDPPPPTSSPSGAPLSVKSPHVRPLGLNDQDLDDLEAFLATTAQGDRRILPPELPPGL